MTSAGPGAGVAVGAQALALSLDVSAVPAQPVGAGRYTIDLVHALAGRPEVSLVLWCRRGDADRWAALGGASVRAVAPARRPLRLAWEQLRLPRRLAAAGVDVHHGPHYTMPERTRLPTVVTVHDLTFLDHPEWHERTKVPVFRRAIRVAARRADAVICVSGRTAARFEELCAPRARVFVAPHGVDGHRFRPGPVAGEGPGQPGDDVWLERLGARPPYVLFLGTLEPRKAVPDLVAAFDRIAGGRAGLSLVLAGRDGWGADTVTEAVAAARHGARVVRVGYVPDAAVPALLRGAAAVAYPSREEGFGLPALEALACGAPLVTTAGTAMEEVSGGAALLVAPGSVPELAEALSTVVDGDPGVAGRRRLGLEAVARHTWAASAAAHVEAYRWAAARSACAPPGRRGEAR